MYIVIGAALLAIAFIAVIFAIRAGVINKSEGGLYTTHGDLDVLVSVLVLGAIVSTILGTIFLTFRFNPPAGVRAAVNISNELRVSACAPLRGAESPEAAAFWWRRELTEVADFNRRISHIEAQANGIAEKWARPYVPPDLKRIDLAEMCGLKPPSGVIVKVGK